MGVASLKTYTNAQYGFEFKYHTDYVIEKEFKQKNNPGYILDSISPHFTQEEAKEALPHLWSILGDSKTDAGGINMMKVRKEYPRLEANKQKLIESMVRKAYGKDINIEDVFKVLDEIPKVSKYQNTSRTANTAYIHDINSQFGDIVANAGGKNFWKKIGHFFTKNAPGFFTDFANNSQWVVESLVKLNKANNPSQGINILKNISKEGMANPAVINHMIKTIKDHYHKKSVDDDE